MRTIGLEEHFWTPEIDEAQAKLGPAERDDNISLFHTPETKAKLEDLGAGRLREMDRIGIDLMLLSLTSPGTQNLPAEVAVPLAKQANDRLAAAVKAHPDRLAGFATLPTPDPDAAARELTRCVNDLGFHGAMINGRTGSDYLDHPKFRAVLGAAEQLGVPIYLHPQIAPRAVRDLYYGGFEGNLSVGFASAGWAGTWTRASGHCG